MKIIHFKDVSIRLPMKNDNRDEIEDKLIEAIDSIGDGVVMSYKVEVEEDGDGETNRIIGKYYGRVFD